ncbi:MAG TPA: polysaccharide lyase family 4 protein [Phycisphaerae bacterium]|nr:polysaccharide lyase family 4 protein [Phycisphaerae bacterium]
MKRYLLPLLVLAVASPVFADPVTVTEDATGFTLSNGTITARINKRNGDLSSMQYKGTEMLTDKSGRAGGYWSHDASPAPGGPPNVSKITMDPKTNNGDRGEVSVKAISGGKKLGHPAGGQPDGDFPADIEIRYSLGKNDSGIYTYCIFTHLPEYPAGSIGEARYCAKLAATFDWLSVDAQRNKYYPEEPKGEDKYVYTAVQSKNLAYGWSSTKDNVGMWIVNPTIEYLSGGPTKPEFMCHRDTTQVAAPCVLNYWRSSHYGGAAVGVNQGESWTKVIGPFMLYVNSGGDHDVLWKDALAKAQTEKNAWPYDWVTGVDYPHKNERSTVTGTFNLDDPLMPGGAKFSGDLTVGLAAPTYPIAAGPNGGQRMITWQTDAKHYEFWDTFSAHDGKFSIPNVRPGSYTLYAFADGVLGEFTKANVTIPEGGKPIDLGTLDWKPVRHGKQLWDIGIPNRTATEFAGADHYFAMDIGLQYPKLFPDDVSFTPRKSDPAKDWFFQQVPHNVDPNAQIVPFSGIRGQPGKPTPYAIHFDLPDAPTPPKGTATLRLAICGTGARQIDVSVNDKDAGPVRLGMGDGVITRHQIQGIWYEKEFPFDASLMKQGANTLTLTVPSGPITNGVIYDYLRLELDENAPFQAAAQ